MFRKRKTKRVVTAFRGYFQYQPLNKWVKNLYVVMPGLSSLVSKVRLQLNNLFAPMLSILIREHQQMRKKISIIDLSILNNILAVHLKNTSVKMVKLSKNTEFRYEKMNLQSILTKQGELLKDLLLEQQEQLRKQSQEILKEKQEWLQEQQRKKTQRRHNRK